MGDQDLSFLTILNSQDTSQLNIQQIDDDQTMISFAVKINGTENVVFIGPFRLQDVLGVDREVCVSIETNSSAS